MKILVINCGSSSIKYQLYEMKKKEVLASGFLEKIGEETSMLFHKRGKKSIQIEKKISNHKQGLCLVVDVLLSKEKGAIKSTSEIFAIGHRVVHGGEDFVESALITGKVIEIIDKYKDLAPLHNPPNLMGIEAAKEMFPEVPQVAVFDTAFHQTIPQEAYLYALPYEFYEKDKIRRYGFHGTSHRYVSKRAAEILSRPLEELDIITCHLGNGCSMTAVKRGKSIDTSMGFTPLEGLVMGTRSGDIDPAIIFFLSKKRNLSLEEIDEILNKKSGLLGISGVSNDLRENRKEAKKGNTRAKLAIDIFCYRIKKYIGAYIAILGRLDALVFTGGIGESATKVRASICDNMKFLGIELEPAKNASCHKQEAIISNTNSLVKVLVIPTDEEMVIAEDTLRVVTEGGN